MSKTHNEISLEFDWWLVMTKSLEENRAKIQLSNQGFNTYLPLLKEERICKGRQSFIKAPLFPRYLFIQANKNAKKSFNKIKSTLGVSYPLMIGEKPVAASYKLIKIIKKMENLHSNKAKFHFNKGDLVKVVKGPFKGIEAIFQENMGDKRGIILLDLIQKATKFTIERSNIRKV